MEMPLDDSIRVEIAVLEKMGLRWAVLAAWHEDLRNRGVVLGPDPVKLLEKARLKISSGCFSTCEVGCDLADVERLLVMVDASSPTNSMEYWVGLLGRCMAEGVDKDHLLNIPAVKFHYAGCRLRPCRCDE